MVATMVQAPEAVRDFAGLWPKLDSDHVIGSGPWRFEWSDDGVKFLAARGGHREASLDELWVTEPHSVAGRFIDGPLEETLVRDRRDAALIRSRFGTAEGQPADQRTVESSRTGNLVFTERRDERFGAHGGAARRVGDGDRSRACGDELSLARARLSLERR